MKHTLRKLFAFDAHGGEHPERVESLDVLRGLLALCVALYHFAVWTHALEGGARSAAVILGVYSVEGFFVISGFCFFHLYAGTTLRGAALWRFHIKRFFRIAPLYYCAILLGVVFAFDQTVGPRVTLGRVVENITLSFGLIHPNHAMVLGGWSIGIEYVFYLVLPVLLRVARARWALYALGVVLLACAVPYNFGSVQAAAEPQQFHEYVQIPNHAFLFVLGAVIADLRAHLRFRLPWLVTLALLTFVFTWAARAQPEFLQHLEVMVDFARVKYVALCWLTVLLFAFTKLPTGRVFRPLAWLGEISYSVYLMHPYAWRMLEPWLGPALSPITQLFSGLCATLALATLTWRFVEKPFSALGQRLARDERQVLNSDPRVTVCSGSECEA